MKKESGHASTRFRVTSNTLLKSFQENIALVHMKRRRIHVLDGTAVILWNLLSSGNSRSEIEQKLSSEFSVGEEELSTEIDRMLSLLLTEDFIQPYE